MDSADIAQDLRLAQAMIDDALEQIEADDSIGFFDGLVGLAIARRIATECGFNLEAELVAARSTLRSSDNV